MRHNGFFVCVSAVVALTALPTLADAETTYAERCAVCHENPDDTKAVPRSGLETMGSTRLRFALLDGKMKAYTTGMEPSEVDALVDLLAVNDKLEEGGPALCPERAISVDVAVSHWGIDLNNSRNQPNSRIDSTTVGDLKLKFAFGIPGVGEMRSYPAVSADTIFLPSVNGSLYAIDRDIGCVKWAYKNSRPLRTSAHLALQGERSVIAVGDASARIHLLDALSGEKIWSEDAALFNVSMATGSPVAFEGDWFIPISAFEIMLGGNPRYECCKSHGGVARLMGESAERLWTARMTEKAEPTYKNSVGTQMYGPSGAPVWTTPAIDSDRNVLYIGTGENTSSPATETSDAIVAIDLDTGDFKWVYQGYANDAFNIACPRGPSCPKENGPDFDFGASPIIATHSSGKQIILAGQKSGVVHALDPDENGKLLWKTQLSNGSVLGGVHWGMAVVGDLVYVPIADSVPMRDPKPGVYALDILTGELVWEYRAQRDCEFSFASRREKWPECPWHFGFSAAATATNDVVFAGALDGRIFAFHAESGEVLFEYNTKQPYETIGGTDAHGGAIDNPGVVVAGNQVIVLSGYNLFGQMPGNVMLVFEI